MSVGVSLNKDRSVLYSRCFIISLSNCIIISISNTYSLFLEKGISIFGGLYYISYITNTFSIFLLIICFMIGLITSFFPRKVLLKEKSSLYKIISYTFIYNKNKIINIMSEQYKISEYTLILLFIIIGGVFLMSANDLISLFLSIELQSYGLYILSSIYRNSESSTSAGLTYFLLGSLSSCFILLSTSLLYANSGSTSLDSLYIISNISDTFKDVSVNDISNLVYLYNPYYIHFCLVVLSVGFLFKVSAAPFHFWSPDVYDGVPTVVTTFISIVAKITIFVILLELVDNSFNSLYASDFVWTSVFLISSILSLVIGAVLGLTQTRIKRLLAYSSISHIGFILLVLSIKSIISIQALLFYLMQYTISSLNMFVIIILIGYSLYNYIYKLEESMYTKENEIYTKEINNSPIQLIDQLKGYFYINPILAISLSITLFSFIGVPPLIGFFAKFLALFAAVNNGYIFMSIVAIVTSVVSAVYYLTILKKVFFEKTDLILNPFIKNLNLFGILRTNTNDVEINFNINSVTFSSSITILTSILTLILLLFIFMYAEWLKIANLLSLSYIY